MNNDKLTIDGHVENSTSFDCEALNALPAEALIEDVSSLEPSRSGRAASLAGLLNHARPTAEATHVTLNSHDGFSASLPLAEVRDLGIVLYEHDGKPLDARFGGPFRFLIPNAAACKTADLDACANVKHLVQIELTAGAGRDTRRS